MIDILVLNGPNLNLLGVREPHIYGLTTLEEIARQCRQVGARLGLAVDFRQSNHEGQLVDWIQEARATAAGIVINPAGCSFTSVAIVDALKASELPVVEVHISNIHRRDAIHQKSLVSLARLASYAVSFGYEAALAFLAQHLGAREPASTYPPQS